MQRTTRVLAIFLAIGVGGASCVASDGANSDADDVADDGKADIVRPVGNYKVSTASPGGLTSVTLNQDRSFELEEIVPCGPAICDPRQSFGTYRFTKSGDHRYIRFYDEEDNFLGRYEYQLSGEALKLRRDGTTEWRSLAHQVSQCEAMGGQCVDEHIGCNEEFPEDDQSDSCPQGDPHSLVLCCKS